MRNQKGITLIALVITIIVLLILAGVSIAMLTGQNGILTRATDSNTETIQAEVKEKINLALNEVYTDILAGKTPTAPVIGDTDGHSYTGMDSITVAPSGGGTVVTITYTGDADIGTYVGSITYNSNGTYTINQAKKS